MKRVVTIGGGHGSEAVLAGLTTMVDLEVTAITGNSDSGGKTKKAMVDYGAASYLGDLTRCIAAMCSDGVIASALNHRFVGGGLDGWTLRHVMLLALEKAQPHDLDEALERMHRLCGARYRAIPVTRGQTKLKVRFRVGNQIEEEADLDTISSNPLWNPHLHEIKEVFLHPFVDISEKASLAIREADYCVLCPGSFFGSTIAALLPRGVQKAFEESKAKIVFFLNLLNVRGETHHMDATDFVSWIRKVIGRYPHHIVYHDWASESGVGGHRDAENRVRLGRVRADLQSRGDGRRYEKLDVARLRFTKASIAEKTDGGWRHNPIAIAAVLQRLFDETEEPLLVNAEARAETA